MFSYNIKCTENNSKHLAEWYLCYIKHLVQTVNSQQTVNSKKTANSQQTCFMHEVIMHKL